MKNILILLLTLISSLCFAIGQSTITLPLDTVNTTGDKIEGGINFSGEGEISTELNLLRDRVYNIQISLSGQSVEATANVKFMYKYAYVGQYSNTVTIDAGDSSLTGNNYLTTPDRFDKTFLIINLKSGAPFTVSKIDITTIPEPMLYGHFITPFYRGNLTKDMASITFRYYSNHEEKGLDDNSVVLNSYISNETGVLFTQTEKVTYPKGYVSFNPPALPVGNYIFKTESKHGEEVLATYETPLIFTDSMPSFYCDQNGRLIKDKEPFLLIGLTGDLENVDLGEARALGINTAPAEGFLQIGKDIILNYIENPWDYEALKAIKSGDAPTLFILRDPTFAPFSVSVSDFIGFDFQINAYDEIKSFFKDYGFYYPLINLIDVENISNETFWETLAQTQTGFIFKINSKESFEKIKPYLSFLSQYKDIILSNDEPKSLVFGGLPSFVRKYNNEEYVFIFETKGKESDVDVFSPGKKDKVYIGNTLLEPDKKDKTKHSFKIEPYKTIVVRIESVK